MSLFPWSWLKGRTTSRHNEPRSPSSTIRDAQKRHLSVTETAELENHIQLEETPPEGSLELFCPVHRARIFCHSIVIDKLGGLTKFIVTSLHEGHAIEEVNDLTRMGEVTIQEEVDYLIRGGLLDVDMTLTPRGHEYGELLTAFADLSDGIEVSFNEFANLFEYGGQEYAHAPIRENVISGNWIPALSRNENYANSREIALDHIKSDIPLSSEVKDSLYTTVRIDNETSGYKRVRVKDLDYGTSEADGACVRVSIPFSRVSYRPRYLWLNPYRGEIETLKSICDERAEELLTDLARRLLKAASEEESADIITVDIDEITGAVRRPSNDTYRLQEGDELIRIGSATPLRATLDPDECRGIFLEEVGREELRRIACFSYAEMEAC